MSQLFVWMCFIILLMEQFYGASTASLKAFSSNSPGKNNSFAILTFIAEHIPPQQIPHYETIKSCPKLWTQTKEEFKEKEETGVLGLLPKIQELCPETQKNLTPVCKGAVWISTYVCTASQGRGKDLPAVKDLKNVTNVDGLCNALVGNSNLTDKLCGIVETSLKSRFVPMPPQLKEKLEQSCIPSNGTQEICVEYCHNDNLPLCKIILQSLRTIVSWEEEKEKGEAQQPDIVSNSETVDSPSFDSTKVSSSSSTRQPQIVYNETKKEDQNNEKTVPLDSSKSTIHKAIQPPPVVKKTVDEEITTESGNSKDAVPLKTEPKPLAAATRIPETTLGQDTDYDMEAAERPPVKSPGEEEPQIDDDAMDQQNTFLEDDDDADKGMEKPIDTVSEEKRKPVQSNDPSEFDSDPINTHFLFYFIVFVVLSVSGYLIYMRRKYLIALMIEGRTGSGSSRRRSNSLRERPSSGSYRKLVNNLEEAITSNSVKNSNVIY